MDSDLGTFSILPVPTGPVGAAAVDPHDTALVYLGGSEGIFRSAGWALNPPLPDGYQLYDSFCSRRYFASFRS
jgi:hypothetical protein